MVAPKGNDYGVGHGRPREYDRDEEARALIEYANKDDSIILRKAFLSRGYTQEKALTWCQDTPSFREAYEYASQLIGARREELAALGQFQFGVFSKYAYIYDKQLDKAECDRLAYESKLKSQEASQVGEKVSQHLDQVLAQVSSLQSARANSISKDKADAKS